MASHHGGGKRNAKKIWWPCSCGSWAWADRAACPACGAAPSAVTAKWLAGLAGGSASKPRTANQAKNADGRTPKTITVGDFTLVVGTGRKAQQKARREMQQLQQLAADARAAKQSEAAGGKPADDAAAQPAAEEPAAMDAEPGALQEMADEELELVLKALAKSGLPGREEYLAEQRRRKEAKLAAKPAWVKVKAVEAKWRKAQAKTAKAASASQDAAAAVEAAKAALVKAEAAAMEASRLLAEAKEGEACAKAEVERPGVAPEATAAEQAATPLPGFQQLPEGYKQQPEVAEKLRQLGTMWQELLEGARKSTATEAGESPGTAPGVGIAGSGVSSHGRRSREVGRSEDRAASLPASRDRLWAAANTEHRSRSPARDLRHVGRRMQDS